MCTRTSCHLQPWWEIWGQIGIFHRKRHGTVRPRGPSFFFMHLQTLLIAELPPNLAPWWKNKMALYAIFYSRSMNKNENCVHIVGYQTKMQSIFKNMLW